MVQAHSGEVPSMNCIADEVASGEFMPSAHVQALTQSVPWQKTFVGPRLGGEISSIGCIGKETVRERVLSADIQTLTEGCPWQAAAIVPDFNRDVSSPGCVANKVVGDLAPLHAMQMLAGPPCRSSWNVAPPLQSNVGHKGLGTACLAKEEVNELAPRAVIQTLPKSLRPPWGATCPQRQMGVEVPSMVATMEMGKEQRYHHAKGMGGDVRIWRF